MNIYILCLLALFTTLSSYAQDHILDTTVYLRIGDEMIECDKRYILYDPNFLFNKDTTFYNPPKFYTYLFSDYKFAYVKTYKHIEHSRGEDEFGDPMPYYEYETDSTSVSTYFGEISKDSLIQLLLSSKHIVEPNLEYPINSNFQIIVSKQNAYRKILGCELDFENHLRYEITTTFKGDIVIIRDINFQSNVRKGVSMLSAGYWRIK